MKPFVIFAAAMSALTLLPVGSKAATVDQSTVGIPVPAADALRVGVINSCSSEATVDLEYRTFNGIGGGGVFTHVDAGGSRSFDVTFGVDVEAAFLWMKISCLGNETPRPLSTVWLVNRATGAPIFEVKVNDGRGLFTLRPKPK
ncbi:MAG: hypothetical protein DI565_11620 [Ancylobacter novellus]|uniref:Secreted protein n=1 Tax=Ancylobacter novellus TaxID=921 RepID=A0A2W5KJK1_ANCNO|nr:MAG: hypothetical protein DI565_11620 [Ancylobacter novellus]